MEYPQLEKYFALAKVEDDPATGLAYAWGISTAEVPDCDRERANYQPTKAAYQAWSAAAFDATSASGQEISLGNVRVMHSAQIGGKATTIEYRDDAKEIWLGAVAVDDEISRMLREGYFTGFSHAGRYGRRWHDACGTDIQQGNYCPKCQQDVVIDYYPSPISEVSFVDRPALGLATYAYVKADGSQELRKFKGSKMKAPTPIDYLKTAHATIASAHRKQATKLSGSAAEFHNAVAAGHEAAAKAFGSWVSDPASLRLPETDTIDTRQRGTDLGRRTDADAGNASDVAQDVLGRAFGPKTAPYDPQSLSKAREIFGSQFRAEELNDPRVSEATISEAFKNA